MILSIFTLDFCYSYKVPSGFLFIYSEMDKKLSYILIGQLTVVSLWYQMKVPYTFPIIIHS